MASYDNTISLPGIPSKLRSLSKQLAIDPHIQRELGDLIDDAVVVAGNFSKSWKTHSENLTLQGALVQQSCKPEYINVNKLEKTLKDSQECFSSSRMDIIKLETKIHCQLETCRGQVKTHKEEQISKTEQIERARIGIRQKKSQIKSNEDDARSLDKTASDLDDRADDLRRMEEKKKENALIGGIISGVVGVVLAPFTLGGSLVVGAAAAGITVGINLESAAECSKGARSCRSSASDKRQTAIGLRDDVSRMESEINDLQRNISALKERIGALEDAIKALNDVVSFLRSSVSVSDEVVTAIQEMDCVLRECSFSGDGFAVASRSKSKRLIEMQLQKLKDSWQRIQLAMNKNRMFAVKN